MHDLGHVGSVSGRHPIKGVALGLAAQQPDQTLGHPHAKDQQEEDGHDFDLAQGVGGKEPKPGRQVNVDQRRCDKGLHGAIPPAWAFAVWH
jgi:hypothetical protein